jgi:hypothetical protein
MVWVAAAGLIIVFLYLMSVNELIAAIGCLLMIGVGVLVLGFGGWLVYEHFESAELQEQELRAIQPRQIQLRRASLGEDEFGWRLTGDVINRSSHDLKYATIEVFLENCVARVCTTVAQQSVYILNPIPAGQARGVDEVFTFTNPASLNRDWSWRYEITEVQADLRSHN